MLCKYLPEIPGLGWVDDIITVSESGQKSSRLIAFIKAKLAIKKLKLGAKKCFIVHIGKNREDYQNVQRFVDGWSVQTQKNYDTGDKEINNILKYEMIEFSHIKADKYLGQVISSDLENSFNITKLRNKCIGMKK